MGIHWFAAERQNGNSGLEDSEPVSVLSAVHVTPAPWKTPNLLHAN
jgi:hypothetical protein